MAEERIVEDDLGRGVKLRKTKDGYVDVTDELVAGEETEGEEIAFAYPEADEEDDEDLVGLSPEEAALLRKQKAEAAERRRAEYERLVAEGNELLAAESYRAAELKFEKALDLDTPATDASVGYWRAKTSNFAEPDVLMDEYVEAGIESLEYDLGYDAVEIIKKEHQAVFQKRYDALKAEKEPLFLEVSEKQERRRAVLKERRKRRLLGFLLTALPLVAGLILTAVFASKINTTPDDTYLYLTIGFGAASFLAFLVFALASNKLLNANRMYRKNEKLSSTEEGERLQEIMDYLDLYREFLLVAPDAEETAAVEEREE